MYLQCNVFVVYRTHPHKKVQYIIVLNIMLITEQVGALAVLQYIIVLNIILITEQVGALAVLQYIIVLNINLITEQVGALAVLQYIIVLNIILITEQVGALAVLSPLVKVRDFNCTGLDGIKNLSASDAGPTFIRQVYNSIPAFRTLYLQLLRGMQFSTCPIYFQGVQCSIYCTRYT